MVAVELAGVETQGVAAGRCVAGEALGAAGKVPGLRADGAVFDDVERLVGAFVGNEGGVGLCVVPTIRGAVAAGRGLHEETGLDAAGGGGIAAGELEVEVFHPDGASGV